jgi:hypothetical protein
LSLCRFVLSLSVAGLLNARADIAPLFLTNGVSGPVVNLAWTPSPSPVASGYFLNWGSASGQCTNQLDAGNITNVTVAGMVAGVNYYFNVVAYDATGDQAPPSNELVYALQPPTLSLQLVGSPNASSISFTFQGSAGVTYLVQATQDFQQWLNIGTTNCLVAGPIVMQFSDTVLYPQRFYRLAQQ